MSGKKAPPRRCPLCAEPVKADAVKCRACGSTLARVPGLAPAKTAGKGDDDDAWPAPGEEDVGLMGFGAVVGGLVGFGVGVWFVGPGLLPVVVVAGAAAGGALGRARG
ncbi:MAG: hypothetical protein M9894_19050 [Planctomycetes bacterium]|nr:hypothetical protein [Planctomycetota bacterium]